MAPLRVIPPAGTAAIWIPAAIEVSFLRGTSPAQWATQYEYGANCPKRRSSPSGCKPSLGKET